MPVTVQQVVTFLRTNPHINRINFQFRGFRVYPRAYQVDVAGAVNARQILIHFRNNLGGAGAQYDFEYDTFEVDRAFDPTLNLAHAAILVHEATHAHMDIQGIGPRRDNEAEAVAYLSEAVFLRAQRAAALIIPGTNRVPLCRQVAFRIAATILAGTYAVSPRDVKALIAAVDHTPGAVPRLLFISNGFNRDWVHRHFRATGNIAN